MGNPTYSILDLFFGPSAKRFEGVDLPKRPVTELVGAVRVEDVGAPDNLTRVTIGVGADVVNDADPLVVTRELVGHATTTNTTPLDTVLDTMDADGAWSVEGVITCRDSGAAVNLRVRVYALMTRIASATSITSVAVEGLGTGGLGTSFEVDGDDLLLRLTGLAATNIRWGYTVSIQKQGF